MGELEANNRRLVAESVSDKAKLRGLGTTVSGLEARAEELVRALEELRGVQGKMGRRERKERRRSSTVEGSIDGEAVQVSCNNIVKAQSNNRAST